MGLLDSQTQQAYYEGSSFGTYQFVSLTDIINNFLIAYVGEGKLIQKVSRTDIAFHAQRALAELSFDTFKSTKAQEIEIPSSLTMMLPQDYVNYVNIAWRDASGIEHTIYPARKTSNPTAIQQYTEDDHANGNKKGDYKFDTNDVDGDSVTTELLIQHESSTTQSTILDADTSAVLSATNSDIVPGMVVSGTGITAGTTVTAISGTAVTLSGAATVSATNTLTYTLTNPTSDTWTKYKAVTPSENQNSYEDDNYDFIEGQRFGIDPQHAQVNGSFFIDENTGKIHFSSNISGKTVTLKYISDSLGTDDEMKVHKLAEEAIYKWISYGVLCAKVGIPEYIINRFKKQKFAETRKAKLRLSNIKIEEITQVLRGKSKHIKH